MLKKCIAVVVFIFAIAVIVSSTQYPYTNTAFVEQPSAEQGDVATTEDSLDSLSEKDVINIYTCNTEMLDIFSKYADMHPEFELLINYTPDAAGAYFREILTALQTDNGKEIDIYCVPGWYAEEFIKGEYAGYASTYKELGIDVDTALNKADIPRYAVEAGTNPDEEIVTLPYEASVGVFMYRRSIAKKVWGTDEPDTIADIIGANTKGWDKFLQAAQTLKENGYYIVPGFGGIWPLIDKRLDKNQDRNPKWEEVMDISKHLLDKSYMKESQQYTEQWIKELDGKGDKQIFGLASTRFFEWEFTLGNTYGDWAICRPPISNIDLSANTAILVNNNSPHKDKIGPLIEWITLDSSETGLQYCLANDGLSNRNNSFYGLKRPVVSGSVLKNVDGSVSFLGGQNLNTVIYDVQNAVAEEQQGYNSLQSNIAHAWYGVTLDYLTGETDKETAFAAYKEQARREQEWLETYYYDPAVNTVLNIYSMDQELESLVKKYAEMHPEFKYKIHSVQGSMIDDNHFLSQVIDSLEKEDGSTIDIYSIPSVYAKEFIEGRYSKYACTYKELGIDVDASLKKADIAQYAIETGTNADGEVVALPYETSVYTFMYRRSIAKKVWGTDDPDKIAEIIGTDTGNWTKFAEAAQTLKQQGYDIVPGCYGIWPLFADGIDASDRNRIGNNMLPQKWEQFFEVAKFLYDNGCIKDIDPYTDEWVQALDGKGDKPVFGFITTENQFKQLGYEQDLKNTAGDWAFCLTTGVNTSDGTHSGIMVNKNSLLKDKIAPLIEWITLDCSETGLQHRLANDTLYRTENVNDELYKIYGAKRTVASGAIMKNTSNCIDFLGGQNINTIVYNTIRMSNREKHQRYTSLDSAFNSEWFGIVRDCLKQDKSKETAIAEFKAKMRDIEKRHKEYMSVIY